MCVGGQVESSQIDFLSLEVGREQEVLGSLCITSGSTEALALEAAQGITVRTTWLIVTTCIARFGAGVAYFTDCLGHDFILLGVLMEDIGKLEWTGSFN